MPHLKITSTSPRIQYEATAAQTDFVIPFRFFQDDDIEVYLDASTTPEDSGDYTITGANTNANGTLSFSSGQDEGTIVTIVRTSTIERTVDFTTSGDWTADDVNDQLDKLTTYIQEVKLKSLDLAVTLPVTTQLTELSFPDAGAASNANQLIGWNSAGTGLQNISTASISEAIDLLLGGLADDDILQYNSSSEVWENKTLTALLANAITTAMLQTDSVTPIKIDTSVNALGSIGGGTQDIDLDDGRTITGTVDTSTTTFTFSNPKTTGNADAFDVFLTNGGSQTINWPASVDWVGGTAPTLTVAGVDHLVFTTNDAGTTWYGYVVGLDVK